MNALHDPTSPPKNGPLKAGPVTYGESDRPPRGDYSVARADYTCDQDWQAYTPAEHALYARLYQRQIKQVHGRACNEFIEALTVLDASERIPRFEDISAKLRRATGWELAAVPGLVPDHDFFSLLSQRRFPVTVWLRKPEEFDYIVEPDVFHDLFGHVPLLFNPVFADYMQAFGQGGLKSEGSAALEYMARLYWYTVEFGLIRSPNGLRVYGAGILSSAGELVHSLTDPHPQRVEFDLLRVMRSRYKIDAYQETYFVIDSFDHLFHATAPDFAPLYEVLKTAPPLAANQRVPGEKRYPPNAA
jgi:phenylalanine-4-hydroxylase